MQVLEFKYFFKSHAISAKLCKNGLCYGSRWICGRVPGNEAGQSTPQYASHSALSYLTLTEALQRGGDLPKETRGHAEHVPEGKGWREVAKTEFPSRPIRPTHPFSPCSENGKPVSEQN